MRGRWIRRAVPLLACAIALLAGGCGGDETDPVQEELNSGVRAALEAQGVPADLADCLTEELEREFPVERLEELTGQAQENPFAAFGADEQESILRISQACGGPPALFGGGGGQVAGGATAAPAATGSDAYFDCVASAGSSEAIKECEKRHAP